MVGGKRWLGSPPLAKPLTAAGPSSAAAPRSSSLHGSNLSRESYLIGSSCAVIGSYSSGMMMSRKRPYAFELETRTYSSMSAYRFAEMSLMLRLSRCAASRLRTSFRACACMKASTSWMNPASSATTEAYISGFLVK
eukprot:scaffold55898_cov78-Phaeocystis_antarctica.AAC.2